MEEGEEFAPGSAWKWDAQHGLFRCGQCFASRKTLETKIRIKIVYDDEPLQSAGPLRETP